MNDLKIPSSVMRITSIKSYLRQLLVVVCATLILSTVLYVVHFIPSLILHRSYSRLSKDIDGRWRKGSQSPLVMYADDETVLADAAPPHVTFRFAVRSEMLSSTWGSDSNGIKRRYTSSARNEYSLEEMFCPWHMPEKDKPRHNASVAILSFTVHGNAGSASQYIYWGCAMSLHGLRSAWQLNSTPVPQQKGRPAVRAFTYSFQLASQAVVHRGRVLAQQADFIADGVEEQYMKWSHQNAGDFQQAKVWLIGHSMGGIAARMAAILLHPSVPLQGTITLNSPHRYPPFFFDKPIEMYYRSMINAERAPLTISNVHQGNTKCPTLPCSSPVTSEYVTRVCGSSSNAKCAELQREHRAMMISITSGEMDLQIEPWTTYPVTNSRPGALVSFWNTLEPSICSRSSSHNNILDNACMVGFATSMIVALVRNANETYSASEIIDLNNHLVLQQDPSLSVAQVPLPFHIFWLARWGQLCFRQRLWPITVCTLYLFLLVSGLLPLLWSVQRPLYAVKRPLVVRCLTFSIATLRMCGTTVMTSVISAILVYVSGAVVFFVRDLSLPSDRTTGGFPPGYPWQWDRYLQYMDANGHWSGCRFVRVVLRLPVLGLHFCGPMAVGILVGYTLTKLIRRLCTLGLSSLPSGPWKVSLEILERQPRWVVPVAILTAYVASATVLNFSLTNRSFMWLGISLLMARVLSLKTLRKAAATPKLGQAAFPSFPVLSCEHYHEYLVLPLIYYPLMYFIQLQPYFTLYNQLASFTVDNWGTVDHFQYVVEGCLVMLLIGTYTLHNSKTKYQCRTATNGTVVCALLTGSFICAMLFAANPLSIGNAPLLLLAVFPAYAYEIFYIHQLVWMASSSEDI